MDDKIDVVDTQNWPVVYVTIPETIRDTAVADIIQQLQSILNRDASYVVIFKGPEKSESQEFNREYAKWFKRTKAVQKKLCRGVVRIEENATARKKMQGMALKYLAKVAIPYPYEVCNNSEEAAAIALDMMHKT